MIAHKQARSTALEIVQLDVRAPAILDLRDPTVLEAVGIDVADAASPWQEVAASGGTPRSWTVRDRLIGCGANGLIDPSRKSPGLWHLELFRWNEPDALTVRLRRTAILDDDQR